MLTVVPTLALLGVHDQVHAALRHSLVSPRELYAVGAWIPPCTWPRDSPAQLTRGIDPLHEQPGITAHINSAGLLDTATGDVLSLATLLSHR